MRQYYRDNIAHITDSRNNFLDPISAPGIGYIFQNITCRARKVDDLNIVNNDFNSPLDHSIDVELGIIQSKGSKYYHNCTWHCVWINEHEKDFDHLIFYCMDKDMKNVERVYIFPWEEVLKRSNITIYKNSIGGWYRKYRVDEKPFNDAYHELLEDIEKGNDPVLRKRK